MSKSTDNFFPEGWLQSAATSVLYRSERQWATVPEAQKSAHFMRRAWDRLELEAILVVEEKPTVYFKHVTQKDPAEEAELHRRLWNQGTATLLVVRDATEVRVYSALAAPDKKPIAEQNDARLVETLQHVQSAVELEGFIRRVETGRIYHDHGASFQAETGVDRTFAREIHL